MRRIAELRLRVVNDREESEPTAAWDYVEPYEFFAELSSVWLQPASENLISLTLHSDDIWGYMSKADFRGLHFPKLKRLELGDYTFSHDWQLERILSHKTIEELVLDDCAIVRRFHIGGPQDEEHYILMPTEDGERSFRYHNRRWADFFARVKEGLPNLTQFRFVEG